MFVDATTDDDPTTTGAEIAYGPRVGPHTLESMLCSGRIQVVGMQDGTPVVTSRATRAIPPTIHHVAIHGNGYRIDPESPPQKRRLIRRLRHTSIDPP